MTILTSILTDEFERTERMLKKYLIDLSKLPKGSIVVKKRNDSKYCYLTYRDKQKIITEYLGTIDSNKVLMTRGKLMEREKLKNIILELKHELNKLDKILKNGK